MAQNNREEHHQKKLFNFLYLFIEKYNKKYTFYTLKKLKKITQIHQNFLDEKEAF